jgi:hypothetical protein
MDKTCIVCGEHEYAYIEIKGVGAVFCRKHCIINDVSDIEKFLTAYSPEKNRIFNECDQWLKSRPEKYF